MSLLLPHSRDCLAEYSTESPHSSVVRIVLHRANSNPVCLSPRETRQEGGYHMYLIRHFERHAAGNNSASQVNWLADIHQTRVRHNLFHLAQKLRFETTYGPRVVDGSISDQGQLTRESDWNPLITQTTHLDQFRSEIRNTQLSDPEMVRIHCGVRSVIQNLLQNFWQAPVVVWRIFRPPDLWWKIQKEILHGPFFFTDSVPARNRLTCMTQSLNIKERKIEMKNRTNFGTPKQFEHFFYSILMNLGFGSDRICYMSEPDISKSNQLDCDWN